VTRIVAGQARGRRLAVPPGGSTRPTSDRVREALFSTLTGMLAGWDGRHVLDLYAGSGALGLEALSRGAASCLFAEKDGRALDVLRRNVSSVGLPGATVRGGDVARLLAGSSDRRYDVALLDPPYREPDARLARVLEALASGWLTADAVLVLERAARDPAPPWPRGWGHVDDRRYGDTRLWYVRRDASAVTGADVQTDRPVRRCACPGSFDPVTNGHLDVLERACQLFDEVVVAVLVNRSKQGLFSVEERIDMLSAVTAHLPNVRVTSFHGLLVDFCAAEGIPVAVKGLRAVTDFDYELQMAQMNHRLSGLDTLFVATNPEHSYLSSSLVRDVATFGGDISALVPAVVSTRLADKLG
jgi:pantetheine-phosphate adenylyltransferase